MKKLLFALLSISYISIAKADPRCDVENLPFLQDRKDLSCVACEMERMDLELQQNEAREQNISPVEFEKKYKLLVGPRDRYWAFLAMATKQFYKVDGPSGLNKDAFNTVLIRLATALGGCREEMIDPSRPILEQTRRGAVSTDKETDKEAKKEKSQKIAEAFPDLSEDEVESIVEFTRDTDAFATNAPEEDRSHQNEIAKFFGFKNQEDLIGLMSQPKGFSGLSYIDLKEQMRTRFQSLSGSQFTKAPAGKYMQFCAKQIQTQTSKPILHGHKPEQVCQRLTRSCYKNNSPESKVMEICGGAFGLTGSLQTGTGPISGGPSGQR